METSFQKILIACSIVCGFIFIPVLGGASVAEAATLISDDFTGTTINTSKWVEFESSVTTGSNIGGTVGTVQQNGALSITSVSAGMTVGTTGLLTVPTYSRSINGDIAMDVDVTASVCSSTSFFLGYGDLRPFISSTSAYFVQADTNGVVKLNYYNNGSSVSTASTSFTCTDNTPFHVKIVALSAGGAQLYINNAGTPSASLVGGTFTNKSFFIEMSGASRSVSYDNLVITATAVVPDAPTNISALLTTASQVTLSWTAPNGNGSILTDYTIEYKLSSDSNWTTYNDGTSTSTSAVVTGLTNSSPYDFRVSAVSGVGASTPSSPLTATPLLVPGAPTSVMAAPYASRVLLSWTPPSNNGATVVDYTVEYKPAGGSFSTFPDGTSTTTQATITGLTNNTTYDFRVTAVSAQGPGVVSSVVYGTPGNIALRDTFSGATIDTTKWVETDAASGGTGATVGNVRQQNGVVTTTGSGPGLNGLRTVSTYSTTNGDASIDADVTLVSCTVGFQSFAVGYGDFNTNTNPGDAVFVRMWNANGFPQIGSTTNGTTTAPGGSVSSFLCTNNVPFHVKFVVLQGGGVQLYINNAATPTTLARSVITGKSFFIQSLASSANATFDNISITASDIPPGAPTNLVAVPTQDSAALSWSAPIDNNTTISDYTIEYKVSTDSNWTTFADGTSTATSATVTGLTSGTDYNFRVSATSANGAGSTTTVTATTFMASAPIAPVATNTSISGPVYVDETLTGVYSYSDGNSDTEGTSTYRWLRSDSAGGAYTAIAGATALTYKLTSLDLNKYIKFEVTPVSTVAPTIGTAVQSNATVQITAATVATYLNHILISGQSLTGGAGPALTTTELYSNKKLNGTTLVPLAEIVNETIASPMANSITANTAGGYQSVVTNNGVGGSAYFYLKKGTGPYTTGINQITDAKNAAAALAIPYRVRALTVIHGESDASGGTTSSQYEGNLVEWQNDFETDAKAITGQTGTIPLFTDQMSAQNTTAAGAQIPLGQFAAAKNNPTKIYLVAPKYMFTYTDALHINNTSQRWLGEYYGKVMKKVLVDGEAWMPLSPISVTRLGNEIYADFHVPQGQLAFDTTLVAQRANYGFNYSDSTSSASITSVDLVDADTVKITLTQVPTGTNQKLGYANKGTSGTTSGASVGSAVGGNLRDTDSTVSASGNTLYNWGVIFNETITESVADTTSPAISFTTPTSGSVLSGSSISLSASASDNIAVTGVQFKLDGANLQAEDTTSPYSINWDSTSTTDGTHVLTATARDGAGNTSTSSTVIVTIDNTSPTRSSGTPSGTVSAGTTSTTISLTTDEAATCRYSTTPSTTYASMVNTFSTSGGTAHSTTVSGLSNSTSYTYYVRCIDVATNPNTTDYAISFSVNTPANIPPTANAGTDIVLTFPTAITTLSGSGNDTDGSIASYLWTQQSGSTAIITTPTTASTTVSGLSIPGTYIFRLTGTDNQNATASDDISIVVSATVPDAPTGATALADNTSAIVSFTTPTSNGGSSILEYVITSIPSGGTDIDSGSTALSHTITGLTNDTSYTFTVTATNNVGISTSSIASNTVIPHSSIISITPSITTTGSIPRIILSSHDTTSCTSSTTFSPAIGVTCPIITRPTLPATPPPLFTRNLSLNMKGEDIRNLQVYLNTHGFLITPSGPGSLGKETTIFGSLTKKALISFQITHNILPATGTFGFKTRAFIQKQ